ncbi:DNA-directed RNA polymerase II core subunit [Saitoella coloradoensis]
MNQPDRFETFYTEPDEIKLKIEPDSKLPYTVTVTFDKEDHTLGNMLRAELLQNEHVIFAGYKVNHPQLYNSFFLRVQMAEGYEPKDAIMSACTSLIVHLNDLKSRFQESWALRGAVADAMEE